MVFQVVEVDVKVEEPGNDNVHNNAFYTEETLLKSELQAMRDCNFPAARHWIVSTTMSLVLTGNLLKAFIPRLCSFLLH